MQKPKVGLLALYLKLYDDTQAALRPEVEAFKATIEKKLGQSMTVVTGGVCRLEHEIAETVERFREEKVDAVVTLHLAYSPSLECHRALGKAGLPILVLDTTPDYSFSPVSGAGRVMQNHGIHGVQDMCSLLRRGGVPYQVFAGHWQHSDVMDRLAVAARGAMMANRMRGSRIGRVGEPFAGMGDFLIGEPALRELGIQVVPLCQEEGIRRLEGVTPEQIEQEWEKDAKRFTVKELSREAYDASARVGLALRAWIEEEGLDGLSVNFLETEDNPALPVMPFLELCKCMERGTGYAGEGDVMNAAFVASLMSAFPQTTFAEMFCPDWEGGSVFCSHMGEFNPAVAQEPLLLTELDFTYTSAANPAALYGCMEAGDGAAFVNLNPIEGGRYTLIAAPGRMLPQENNTPAMQRTVRGWFAPEAPLADFLQRYSELGGGHHGAIIYRAELDALASFARCMGWEFDLIS